MSRTSNKTQATPKKDKHPRPASIPITTASTVPVNVPSPKAVADLVGITLKPTLQAAQIWRLRKALPGYVNLLDDVAELLAEDQTELGLQDVSPARLLDIQRSQKDLAAREAVLQAAHLSAYHQRLSMDDEGMAALQKIARRVQSRAEENPDILLRYKSLLDFLGTFRSNGSTKAAADKPADKPAAG